jgi:hypothetical protein
MNLKAHLSFPSYRGKIVEDYLKVLKIDVKYYAFTLNDSLEIIECIGIISSNDLWDRTDNDIEPYLYVIINSAHKETKWFSLHREDVEKVQSNLISKWRETLEKELERITEIQTNTNLYQHEKTKSQEVKSIFYVTQ